MALLWKGKAFSITGSFCSLAAFLWQVLWTILLSHGRMTKTEKSEAMQVVSMLLTRMVLFRGMIGVLVRAEPDVD